jgi:lipopolysaccharide transport protein LptA
VTLKADRIDFFYAGDPQELDKVVASGNVSFTMETSMRQLQADEVTWFTADNKVEFRGNPKVISERGTLTGESIVHYLSDDRTAVVKPRAVFIVPEKKEAEKEPGGKNEGGQ